MSPDQPTCYFCGQPVRPPTYNPDVPELCKLHWRKLRTIAPPKIVNAYRPKLRKPNPRNYVRKMRLPEALRGLKRFMQDIQEQQTN
jgi:hypothetical protein